MTPYIDNSGLVAGIKSMQIIPQNNSKIYLVIVVAAVSIGIFAFYHFHKMREANEKYLATADKNNQLHILLEEKDERINTLESKLSEVSIPEPELNFTPFN